MNIKKAGKSDNRTLADIIKNVFEEYDAPRKGTVFSDPTTDDLFSLFELDKSVLWVAEEQGEILGCCGIYPTQGLPDKCVELVKFYLDAKARGKGIGLELMNQCIASAKELGYSEMYIESLPDFDNAVKMYEKSGFKLLDERLGASGHDSCNVWMIKTL